MCFCVRHKTDIRMAGFGVCLVLFFLSFFVHSVHENVDFLLYIQGSFQLPRRRKINFPLLTEGGSSYLILRTRSNTEKDEILSLLNSINGEIDMVIEDVYRLEGNYWVVEHPNPTSEEPMFRVSDTPYDSFNEILPEDITASNCISNHGSTASSNIGSNIPSITNLERWITGTGFHRTLNTKITFSSLVSTNEIILSDLLPKGIYVDEFELSRSHSSFQFQIYNYETVDIEKPKRLGEPVKIDIIKSTFEESKNEIIFSYPIHIRYHPPSMEKLKETIYLNQPVIYFKKLVETESLYIKEGLEILNCLLEERIGVIDSFPSFLVDTSRYRLSSDKVFVSVEMPIGQVKDKNLVTWITLSITCFCTLLLVVLVSFVS